MEPQQPGQLGHNPYDFILNPPQTTVKHPLGGKLPSFGRTGSFGLQIGLIVGGAVFLMIIVAIVISVLTGGGVDTTKLEQLAATQQEIVRVANNGSNEVNSTTNQQVAISIALTIQTDQNNLLSFLTSRGDKVSTKVLASDMNANTDTKLQNAQSNSTVDVVFAQIMQSELQSYASTLKGLYNEATDTKLKQLLSTDYAQAELLLQQVPSATSLQT